MDHKAIKILSHGTQSWDFPIACLLACSSSYQASECVVINTTVNLLQSPNNFLFLKSVLIVQHCRVLVPSFPPLPFLINTKATTADRSAAPGEASTLWSSPLRVSGTEASWNRNNKIGEEEEEELLGWLTVPYEMLLICSDVIQSLWCHEFSTLCLADEP